MLHELLLTIPDCDDAAVFEAVFEGCPNVRVLATPFQDVPAYDVLVSPGNSFGLMDGGIDAAITAKFGDQLQKSVQQRIIERHLGEQPVGTCFLMPTGHSAHPWLAHAPTMRAPMDIRGTDNVYVAMLSMLSAVAEALRNGQGIQSVLCPGLGMGYGRMPAHEAARQMRAAWDSAQVLPNSMSWTFAGSRQRAVDVWPTPPLQGSLVSRLHRWLAWDQACFELARSIGAPEASSFHEFKQVAWVDDHPLRESLLSQLKLLVDVGILESRLLDELEFRAAAPTKAGRS